MKNDNALINGKVETKVLLAGLWTGVMMLYVYCDIFSLYKIGQIEKMIDGKMGFLDVSQMTLLSASILMILPTVMIILSLIVPARINRTINIAFGLLYTLVNIGNIVGETWIYYYVFGILEIIGIALIIVIAIKWPRKEEKLS